MERIFQITTTTPSEELAREIARSIVVNRMAACVQVFGPVASFYHWQGQLQEDQEWQCTIKTTSQRLRAVVAHIEKLHSYDEPEIIATEIIDGSISYLKWIVQETSGGSN